jgi:NADH pyrophosphatase NudC (nudix superfamily)
MPKAAKARRRLELNTAGAPAPRNDLQCIGAHADYRREDFVFARTQSLELREAQWEKRLKPLRAWTPNFVANLALGIFA